MDLAFRLCDVRHLTLVWNFALRFLSDACNETEMRHLVWNICLCLAVNGTYMEITTVPGVQMR